MDTNDSPLPMATDNPLPPKRNTALQNGGGTMLVTAATVTPLLVWGFSLAGVDIPAEAAASLSGLIALAVSRFVSD